MTAAAPEPLPIEGKAVLAPDGSTLHLPVRAEEITISKQSVVRERVLVQRKWIEEAARVDAVLRREQLRATKSGPVELHEQVTEKVPTN